MTGILTEAAGSHLFTFIHIRLHYINPNKVKKKPLWMWNQSIIMYMCLLMKSMCQIYNMQS
jgi:hypothetical protein